MADVRMQKLALLTQKQALDDEVLWEWSPLPDAAKAIKIDMASYAGLMGIPNIRSRFPVVKLSISDRIIEMTVTYIGKYIGGGTSKIVGGKGGSSYQLESKISTLVDPTGDTVSRSLPNKFTPPSLGKDQSDALKQKLLNNAIFVWKTFVEEYNEYHSKDVASEQLIDTMTQQKDALSRQVSDLNDKISVLRTQKADSDKAFWDKVAAIH